MAKNEAQSGPERSSEGSAIAVLRTVESALRRAAHAPVRLLARRSVQAAAALAVLGGLLLLYAETLDLYRVVTPGGATSNAAGSIQSGADQHSWALGVIGVAIAGTALLAAWTKQRLPAWAAVALAVIALGVVLVGDIPDVTSEGLTTEVESGEAQPEAGFWAELAGSGAALVGTSLLAWLLSREAGRRRRP